MRRIGAACDHARPTIEDAVMHASTFRILPWIAAIAVLLAAPQWAAAQDADTREIERYVLTDAVLAKYARATRNLAAIADYASADCRDDDVDEADSPSIGKMVARIEAIAGAKAALQAAGIASREYVVFTFSLLQNGLASWAMNQPGGKLPAGVLQANVDFMRKHDAALKELGSLTKDGDCDRQEGNDEP
jgi:hypothetical protein